jgi:protein-S-isoprenylcysteine O-methyltransferase Ste14
MGLDIRLPIGLMFTVFGVLLIVYGFVSDKSIYQRSLGMNVNLGWGVVLLIFGLVMLALGRRAAATAKPEESEHGSSKRGH